MAPPVRHPPSKIPHLNQREKVLTNVEINVSYPVYEEFVQQSLIKI
jgi:hypothetical protein